MEKLFTVLLILFYTQTTHAIVNVSDLHLTDYQAGYSGNIAANLSSLSGNSNQQQYELGSTMRWIENSHSLFLLLDRSYGESESQPYVDKAFIHMRNIWQRDNDFAWELFMQVEDDQFARLSARYLVGAGARFSYQSETKLKIHLGTGLFAEQENLFNSGTTTDGGTQTLNRANLYLVLQYKLDKQLTLVSSTYFQPDLANTSDYRLLEQTSLKYKLNQSMSIKLNLDIKQDNDPPQSIKTTDNGLNIGLEYNF